MPIVVNTNSAATSASFNLSKANDALRRSLSRLSSTRITNPAEDAGGLAVAYKLDSQSKRTEAVLNNHQNALSFLQLQDGALQSVGEVVSRMAELRTMAADVTKNEGDIENYSKEFGNFNPNCSKWVKRNSTELAFLQLGTIPECHFGKEMNVSVYVSGNGGLASDRYSYELLTHPSESRV